MFYQYKCIADTDATNIKEGAVKKVARNHFPNVVHNVRRANLKEYKMTHKHTLANTMQYKYNHIILTNMIMIDTNASNHLIVLTPPVV